MIDVKPWLSLKVMIIGPLTILSAIIACGIAFLVHQDLKEQRLRDALHHGELITQLVLLQPRDSLEKESFANSIKQMMTETKVSRIELYEGNNRSTVVYNNLDYANSIDNEKYGVFKKNAVANLESSHDRMGKFQSRDATFYYAEYATNWTTRAPVLVLVALDAEHALLESQRKLTNFMFLLAVAVLVFFLLGSLLLKKLLFGPIDSLVNTIHERISGKTVLAKVFREDEIGLFASTFNFFVDGEEKARQAIRKRERELKLIFDHVPVTIWYKDDKNTILRVNRSAAASIGKKVEEIEGKDTAEIFPKTAARFYEDDLDVIRSGKPKLNIIEKLDGEKGLRWVKTDKVPYTLDNHSRAGVLVVAQDITELKHAEERLRESEERLNLVIEATRDGIWDWPDIEKDEEYWSDQWKNLLGYGPNEIEARASTFFELIHPDDQDKTRAALKAHLDNGDAYEIEHRLKTKTGDYKWFRAKGKLTRNPVSGVRRMTGSTTDIQYQKEAEQKLKKYNADLERSNKELDEFAYIASHDLKSPLRGIDQLASWIAEDITDGRYDELHENIGLMRGRVQRMEKLLTDLLEYSRVGKQTEILQVVDSKTLVKEVFELCFPPAKFTLDIDPGLPEFTTLVAPFEQVIRNLINNAIKHHNREDGTITIRCTGSQNNDFFEFEIQDDGPGVARQHHELIFKMFKSLKPRDEVEGSGMGLALVKKIVNQYGGEITIKSSEGAGCTFCFTWPKKVQIDAE